MKNNGSYYMHIIRLSSFCIITALLSACASLTTKDDKNHDYASLGDPKSELEYSTAFPVASAEEAIIRGNEAMSKGDIDRALFEYIRALEEKGADGDLFYKIGEIHLVRNDIRRAELSFILVLKEQPEHIGALTELGRLQMQRRDYASARKLLSKALGLKPDSARILNSLGVLEDMTKNHRQANIYFTKAVTLSPNNPTYMNNLGYSHYLQGDHAAAEHAFENTLKIDPNYKRSWRNLGLVYAKKGRYNEALDAFSKVEKEHQAMNDVGYVAMIAGRYDEADYYFHEALRIAPMYYELANRNIKHLDLVREKADMSGQ